MNSKPIAFMDSGVGGLSVLKVALSELPQENMLYLGDEAHMPYGEKNPKQIVDYSLEIGNFFVKNQAKMMIVACNTATSVALSTLQKNLSIPVIGVIKPGSEAALKVTKNQKIGVIATRATIASHSYRQEILKINPKADVIELACPTFIPLVESGDYNSEEAKQIIKAGLKQLKNTGIDTLILGCTHFPIIANLIQNEIGEQVKLIDPGYETIDLAKQVLKTNDLYAKNNQNIVNYFTTSGINHFDEIGSHWLQQNVKAKLITTSRLENYHD
ncbi:glutamate racemase [Fructilactobacillus vespulae]|uniref:glutamate racemase n=1 Tax=Fructilactobacillus vespulae TaxID=1249630 RepID=UPI0039B4D8A2